MDSKSRCHGCKSESRMTAGCPFITCAINKKGIEFCWECNEGEYCQKWKRHRQLGRQRDSFKCYQRLDHDIDFIKENGIERYEDIQKKRERLLVEMLESCNEGRSKSYYCIAATVLEPDELRYVLSKAENSSKNLSIKDKSRVVHEILDNIALQKEYCLKLRK